MLCLVQWTLINGSKLCYYQREGSSRQGVTTQIKCHRTSSILSLWRAEPGPHLRNNHLSAESIPVTHGQNAELHRKGKHRGILPYIASLRTGPGCQGIPREMLKGKSRDSTKYSIRATLFSICRMSYPMDPTHSIEASFVCLQTQLGLAKGRRYKIPPRSELRLNVNFLGKEKCQPRTQGQSHTSGRNYEDESTKVETKVHSLSPVFQDLT